MRTCLVKKQEESAHACTKNLWNHLVNTQTLQVGHSSKNKLKIYQKKDNINKVKYKYPMAFHLVNPINY